MPVSLMDGKNMITSLNLLNFQCHKDAVLEFVPGVNVLAGSSDAGKSAVLRGLLWAITNKPQGLDFRAWGCVKGDVMEAALRINSHLVQRRRSEHVNEYVLDGKKFVAMKTDVPVDVAGAVNMGAVNIQTQFQPHFLLSSSSGEVARVLNDACDLSIIDSTVKTINAIATKAKSDAKAADDLLDDLTSRQAKLQWAIEAESLLDTLEDEQSRIKTRRRQSKMLQQDLEELAALDKTRAAFVRLFSFLDTLPDAQQVIKEIQADSEPILRLSAKLAELFSIEREQEKQAPIIDSELESLGQQIDVLINGDQRAQELSVLLHVMKRTDKELQEAQAEMAESSKELQDVWGETDQCPLCGNSIGACHG